ncbi:MAG: exonuclease domain-containing protein [Bacteroidota bacterium]
MDSEVILTDKIKDAEFCVVDVETTGMSASYARIIEIGMVRIKDMKIIESYRSFVNPGTEIPYFITTLTGISNADVREAPFFDEIARTVIDFIGDAIIVGHNLQFDMSFLRRAMSDAYYDVPENKTLCTLKLARRLFPDLQSKSLASITKHLNISHKNVHRALGDATVTAKALLKMIKKLEDTKGITTVSSIIDYQSLSVSLQPDYILIKKKLAEDYARLPDKPGVYFFRNAKDQVIYVGKAKSLKKRVRDHFLASAPAKSKKIVRQAARLDFEVTNSELTALLAEAEFIKIYNPQFNSMLKRFGQNYFIRILNQHEYPLAESSSKFDLDGNDYFGPYTNRQVVQSLLKLVESAFQLRECSEKVFKKGRICYLAEIERCLAPCTLFSSYSDSLMDEYQKELEKVYDFLSGKNQLAVNRLIERMKLLSEKQKFEEAAETRDMIQLVLSQIHKSSIIAEPVNKANVLIEVNCADKKDYILMVSGKVFIKDYVVQGNYLFDSALDDYFDGAVSIISEVDKKDLEKIKILLSWLSRNRNSVSIYYLKDFSSKQQFLTLCSGKGKFRRRSVGGDRAAV